MKQSQGWAEVIRFDALKPINKETLTPEQQANHTVCQFTNEFIDIFNTQPLPVRLKAVANLFAMVQCLSLAAFAASFHKLPYVEPNRFDTDKGKPVYHLTDEYPNAEEL
jgi:hypothetical protein